MARQPWLLIGALLTARLAVGETPTLAPAEVKGNSDNPRRDARRDAKAAALSPEFADVRKAVEALTPEQRQRFVENFRRWANLSPDEKKALTDRDVFRRRRIQEEVDQALTGTATPLDGDRRAQFAKRYAVERRKIEEQLRRETDGKRQPLVDEMVARLRTEFGMEPSTTATPAPPREP